MTDLVAVYAERVAKGLQADPAQQRVVERLDRLRSDLHRKPGVLDRLARRRAAPEGVYVWGDVGRGKSMLVDLLMANRGGIAARRTHFQTFMRDLHHGLHSARQGGADDPVSAATDRLTGDLSLLVLDELEIGDITDAMIVGRVFRRVFERGIAVVATSNRAPGDLYRDGLKRELFLPFVRLMEEHTEVLHLAGGRDYRRGGAVDGDLYRVDADMDASVLDPLWTAVAGSELSLRLPAARITVRHKGKMVRARFDALCRAPLAAMHYLELSDRCDALFLDGVPRLGPRDEDAARRFIMLIDTLYDRRKGLVVSAAAEPEAVYAGDTFIDTFQRTASRLHEMRQPDWPGRPLFR